MTAINVILADTHILTREGLKNFLNSDPRITVQGQAGCTADLLNLLDTKPCNISAIDISILEEGGTGLLPRLKEHHPGTSVLVTSIRNGEKSAVRAFRTGADGFVWKGQATSDFLDAIMTLSEGKKYIGRDLALKLSFYPESMHSASSEDLLSERELQVMKLIAAGLSMTDLARKLGIDIRTASTYRRRILAKLNLPTNAALIAYAIRENIVP